VREDSRHRNTTKTTEVSGLAEVGLEKPRDISMANPLAVGLCPALKQLDNADASTERVVGELHRSFVVSILDTQTEAQARFENFTRNVLATAGLTVADRGSACTKTSDLEVLGIHAFVSDGRFQQLLDSRRLVLRR